jgi:hypothetical protein
MNYFASYGRTLIRVRVCVGGMVGGLTSPRGYKNTLIPVLKVGHSLFQMALFRCVDKWLTARREFITKSGEDEAIVEAHMDANVNALIPHVRFPMMMPSELADLLLNPLAQSHMELIVEKIRVAMAYHKNQVGGGKLNLSLVQIIRILIWD